MVRLLFVTNGHGEAAIAERIAGEVRALDPNAVMSHFPLVGMGTGNGAFSEVGPRRTMPSGGLVAMGNVRAFSRDVLAGFPALFSSQIVFLRAQRDRYDLALAVGDAYALGMTLLSGLPSIFVGTAKSAYVAPYGGFERMLLKRAMRVFVRDEHTEAALRARGVAAVAPGNVIADLHRSADAALPGEWIGLLPGSRHAAYGDAVRLGRVVRILGERGSAPQALISIAPGLDARRFASAFEADGWTIEAGTGPTPFTATASSARIVAWTGELGALLRASVVVVGQAGTANEAAAAAGIPVVALQGEMGLGSDWYRMRQRRLLGDALATVPPEPNAAAAALEALLGDAGRLARMRAAGLERLGPGGGARRIALETLQSVEGEAALRD